MSVEVFDANTSGEFGTPQLDALIATQPVALSGSHAVYRCVTRAVTQQAVQLKAVHLLAQLSQVPANREACFRCLMSVGGTLEHLLLKGDPANDPGIHVDVLCLLANVGEFKLDASQVLELYNGNVGMSVRALCALLSDTHSKYPLSALMGKKTTLPSSSGYRMSWEDAADQMSAAIRCLYELSTWKHFKNSLRAQSATDVPMIKLQDDFVRHIVSVNQIITTPFKSNSSTYCADSSMLSDGGSGDGQSFFPLLTTVFEDWLDLANCLPQDSDADSQRVSGLLNALEAALSNTILLIVNMLSFTNEFSAKFRAHVAVKSGGFVEKVLIPMVILELDVLEGKRKHTSSTNGGDGLARHALVLQLLLKVIALLGFKTKVFRPALRQIKLLCARLIQNPVMMDSNCKVEFFALVVRLMINTDLDDSVHHVLEAHKRQLTDKQRLFLALRLSNPAEKLYPIDVFCAPYQSLRPVFYIDPVAAAAVNDAPSAITTNPTAPRFNFASSAPSAAAGRTDAPEVFTGRDTYKRVKRRGGGTSMSEKLAIRREAQRRRKKIVAKKKYQQQHATSSRREDDDDADVWEDLGDDEGSDGEESTTFRRRQLPTTNGDDGVEEEELEDFSGVREAVVITVGQGAGAGTGVSLFDEEEDDGDDISTIEDSTAAVLQAARQAQQAQQRGDAITSSSSPGDVVRLTGSSPSKNPAPAPEAPTPAPAAAVVVSGQTGPFDLSKYRTVAPPLGCPDQYLCALTRRLIGIPVISPTGDVFDKEAILSFIKDPAHKNKHPFTGEGLYGRDLVVDVQLRRELDVVRCNYSATPF
jgi:hypothetical protein